MSRLAGAPLAQRLALGVAALLAVVLLVVVLAGRGGSGDGFDDAAAAFAPKGTLVLATLSTDPERDVVGRAATIANRFPRFARVRDSLLQRLSATGGTGVVYQRDIRPWLGDEVALAFVDDGSPTAGSLLVVGVRDQDAATRFLARAQGTRQERRYRGVTISDFGAVATAFDDRHLLLGPEQTLRAAIDVKAGRAPGVRSLPAYAASRTGLPAGRVGEIWLSADGVRRLVQPQSGLVGAVGTLLDQPALRAAAIAITPEDGGARVDVRSALDPKVQRAQPSTFRPFEPTLADAVPSGSLAYLGIAGIDVAALRLANAAIGGGLGVDLGALLLRAQQDLGKDAGVDLARDVLPILRGEVALSLQPASPAPLLTLVAKVEDEQRTRDAIAKLQGPLAKLVTPPDSGPGQAPTVDTTTVGGVEVSRLRLTPSFEVDSAVTGGRLILSTGLPGIRAAVSTGKRLADDASFRAVTGGDRARVTSLTFLDLSELLALAERTGLAADPRFAAIKGDLQKVRAVGVRSAGGTGETTAELHFKIP